MAKIHRMSEHLSNMIAAGEVVERPMGIVKECVENSIDAKATRIEVWITQGGIEEIEIIDNGVGMSYEDAQLAFERHATSKIKDVQDLWSISTLGFRGEALPSISSVASVELRTNDGSEATRVIVDYGSMKTVEPFGCDHGTQLIIRGLFMKTPARLKHLKSSQYETSMIVDVMQKFALSHPEIAFRLVVDGRETFKTNGTNQLLEVMYAIYGKDVSRNCVEINKSDYDAKCTGLAVLPQINRANRNYITLFINQRMVRSYRLQKSIIEAYREYMPEQRYPIVIMHIELDEQLIDVNVHPSKWEIRLSKEQQLNLLVYEAMKDALAQHHTAPEVSSKNMSELEVAPEHVEQIKIDFAKPVQDYIVQEETPVYESSMIEVKKEEPQVENEMPANIVEEVKTEEIESVTQQENVSQPKKRYHFLELEVIGQLHRKYILASSPEGLVILDQHAAQERVNYERFQKLFAGKKAETIDLLMPLTLDVPLAIISKINEINLLFAEIGIEFEVFSQNSVIVRSIPMWMQDLEEEVFLKDCLDLVQEEKLSKVSLNKDKLATKACHRSIRFNRTLTMEEMRRVIDDLETCIQPYHCPHGRPVMITMSEAQLIKEFKR